MRGKYTILKTGYSVMLALLYAAFFAAQLFSVNPDRPDKKGTVLIFEAQQFNKASAAVNHDDYGNYFSPEDIGSLRINKRFHPSEIALDFNALECALPSLPILTELAVFPQADFIPTYHGESVLLRGPPFIAG